MLHFSGVARFTLDHGRRVTVQPAEGADPALVAAYLQGVVFAVVLFQQGALVFHASAVVDPHSGLAVLLAGESGAGKSTAAAMLSRCGWRILCDDVAALTIRDSVMEVLPGSPCVKLAPATYAALGFPLESALRLPRAEGKLALTKRRFFAHTRTKARAVVVLTPGTAARLEPIRPTQLLLECVRHTIPTRLLGQSADALHFRQCGQVATRLAGYRLYRRIDATDPAGQAGKLAHLLGRICR